MAIHYTGEDSPGRFFGDYCNWRRIPQLFNARRFDCPVMAYPTLLRIDAACEALPAFCDAAPDMQSDAE